MIDWEKVISSRLKCSTSAYSSRVCELGTKCCVVYHHVDLAHAIKKAIAEELDKAKRFRSLIPCPDNKEGCLVLHYGKAYFLEQEVLQRLGVGEEGMDEQNIK